MTDAKHPNRVAGDSPYEDRYGFCRARREGDRVLVAGTAPIDKDGTWPADAAGQTRLCFEIVQRALEALGATCDDVVRTRMFITDAADGDAIGQVHGEFFNRARPVATMVVVAGLLDPAWKVEVEAEAMGPDRRSSQA